jgi:predicted kinase
VAPTEGQRSVVARARELARVHLRSGRDFAWNGTNLSRQIRGNCVDLFAAYGARVRIVYVEVPEAQLLRQNQKRRACVPERVIERLVSLWEVPDHTEAHRVDWVIRN